MFGSVVLQGYDYRSIRGIQISIVFFITICVQELWRYPRAGWTGFAVMVIYAGFDNGTTIQRAYQRFQGMFIGLFIGYLLWFIGHVDYRLLLITIPVTVYFAFFLVGQVYTVPTIFTVAASVIGSGYFDRPGLNFTVTNFIVDYSACTLIAFTIIVICEYFWFDNRRMMRLFIKHTQIEVFKKFNHLYNLLQRDKIKRTDWLKACAVFTESLFEMERLVGSSQFVITSQREVGDEFYQFVVFSRQIFVKIKALYLAHYTKGFRKYNYNKLNLQVQDDLMRLRHMFVSKDWQPTNSEPGDTHVAPN